MRPIVLVHGGMHGSWCWKRVRNILAAAGYDVITPTLTGLGERAHLGGAEVDLALHIADVLACVECEELTDFALVGHSYAGMVITGVADRIVERISHLVYLDALLPENGEAAADLVSRGVDYSAFTDGMLPPIAGYDFGLTDPQDIAWVRRRITPQSVRTVTQPISLRSDLSRIRRSFIECIQERTGQPQMAAIAERARRVARDPSWRHYTFQAGHDCMISHPEQTAELLLYIVRDR